MKRLIGFDLDGTLTQHRTPLGEEPKALLAALSEKYKVIMVGAGNAPRIYRQMGGFPIDIIANYGMQESRWSFMKAGWTISPSTIIAPRPKSSATCCKPGETQVLRYKTSA